MSKGRRDTMTGSDQEKSRGSVVRTVGWFLIFGGLLTMSGGLVIEQSSPPAISSLGLILALIGISIFVIEVEKRGEKREPSE